MLLVFGLLAVLFIACVAGVLDWLIWGRHEK